MEENSITFGDQVSFTLDGKAHSSIIFTLPHGTYHLDDIKDMEELISLVEDGRRYRSSVVLEKELDNKINILHFDIKEVINRLDFLDKYLKGLGTIIRDLHGDLK